MRARVIIAVLILFSLACLGSSVSSLKPPQDSEKVSIPLYKGVKTVSIEESDQKLLIEELFGRDNLFFKSNIEIATSDRMGDEIKAEVDKNLPEAKWRLKMDWMGVNNSQLSEWQNGDLHLYIIVFDNLDSNTIKDLNKRFGIQKLETGETLTIAYVIDYSQPLPDLTATTEMGGMIVSATAGEQNRANTQIAVESTRTAKAENDANATLSAAETLEAHASATAYSAAQTAAVTPTPTLDPYPALVLPFEDNFDNGLKPEWRVLGSNQPVFVDGRLTAINNGETSIEIGNGDLREYTLEFDLVYEGAPSGDINFYFTPNIKMLIKYSWGENLFWYEFSENQWIEISRHNVPIFMQGESERVRIIRSGDDYQVFQNGKPVHSMKYGDTSGSPLIIQINDNDIAIDNLIIKQ